ncbi:glycoside hydrolase family 15 protein [Diaminobutyricibacter sp. McL0608]|uniref:glycoside hydrolase family 15 protein n=1 Tax=Leifsonia sp. McL0608 TaxID=3143537 RepID=UPI0031F2D8A5
MPSLSIPRPIDLSVLAPDIETLVRSSHHLIVELQTPEGAYPASPTFSAYEGYCWFRDGAFIADAVSAYGDEASATAFFDWCSRVIVGRQDQIRWIVAETRAGRPPTGDRMLPARFTFAGGDGVDDWWDFQLDGYGTWLWALTAHVERFGLDPDRWSLAVQLTVDYLLSSWSRPCYDWWEEHSESVHVSTLACVAAGLSAVRSGGLVDAERVEALERCVGEIRELITERGVRDGHLVKWLDDDAMDGSLAAAVAPLGVVGESSALAIGTLDAIERRLTVDGGVHRYLGDTFFGGGQWPLLSCFLGLAQLSAGRPERARELLEWAASTANAELEVPEQVDHHLISPGMKQEWLERWGPVATPLLWSHAMIIRLAVQLATDGHPSDLARPEGTTR